MIIRNLLIIFTVLFIGCKTDDSYGSLQIESNVDTTLARIGDIINYNVKTHYSDDIIVDFPDIIETESIEIRSKTIVKKNDIPNNVSFEVVFWDTGKFAIPEYPVHFLKSDSTIDFTMYTDSINILVISMLSETEDRNIRPIKDPVAIKESLDWYRLLLIISLIFLVLIQFGLWRRRIKKPELEKISVSDNLTAKDIALARLEELIKIIEKDNKKFYLHLSFLMREFIENQFYIRALEMTTNEIKSFENDFGIATTDFKGMMNILNRSDLAKFARYNFSLSDRQADLDWMKNYLYVFDPRSSSN